MLNPNTQQLADFISTFDQLSLPENVQQRAFEVIYDGFGALLAATNPGFSTFQRIVNFVSHQGGARQASVLGTRLRTNTVNAALANATLGYACDMEPHHPEAILHPVAVMIPTALAVAESENAGGQTFIKAIILGCEIEYRVAIALGPAEQYALGFHPSAICGCFGATAAASFLLGLDRAAVVRALGLAACQTSGLMAWETDPSENARPFQMGIAARNGITAALLARDGFGGPDAVFDHGHTVFRAFSRAARPQRLTAALGQRFEGIMELALKPYACVSFLHPALDALLALRRINRFSAKDIDRITLDFPRSGIHCIDSNPLKSHCAQYVLAVAAVRGKIEPADLFIEQDHPEIQTLRQCIEVRADDGELEALFPDYYASIITIHTRCGKTYQQRQDIARGYPETWLSHAEQRAKFDTLAGSVAAGERVANLHVCLAELPRARNLSALIQLLAQPAEKR